MENSMEIINIFFNPSLTNTWGQLCKISGQPFLDNVAIAFVFKNNFNPPKKCTQFWKMGVAMDLTKILAILSSLLIYSIDFIS